MEPRISVITLGTADLQRAIRFYRDGLKLPVRSQHEDVIFFGLKGQWLALYPRYLLAEDAGVPDDGTGFTRLALAHNTRSREEVDAVLAEAVEAGGTLVKPGQDVFWGGYAGYFADPDGHLWEVAWNPEFPIDE